MMCVCACCMGSTPCIRLLSRWVTKRRISIHTLPATSDCNKLKTAALDDCRLLLRNRRQSSNAVIKRDASGMVVPAASYPRLIHPFGGFWHIAFCSRLPRQWPSGFQTFAPCQNRKLPWHNSSWLLLKGSAPLAHSKGSHTLKFLALLTSPSLQNNPSSKSATLNLRLSASNPPLRPLCVQLFVFAAEHKIGDDAGLCRGAAASVPIFHDGSGGRTLGFRRLLHYCCISSCKVSPASSTLPRPPALVGLYSFVPSAAAPVNAFNFKTNSQITLD